MNNFYTTCSLFFLWSGVVQEDEYQNFSAKKKFFIHHFFTLQSQFLTLKKSDLFEGRPTLNYSLLMLYNLFKKKFRNAETQY